MTMVGALEVEVYADAEAVAEHAADQVAKALRACVADRGRAAVAFSGGSTPAAMLAHLAGQDVPWDAVDVFQVDERFAPRGSSDRNLTTLHQHLGGTAGGPAVRMYPMPVDDADPERAAEQYAAQLRAQLGVPPVVDLVHLGLGDDGHTASLVPGDPVVEVADRDVAVTGTYRGWRRLTLTRPTLDLARTRLWVVAGAGKADAVARLVAADATIPAGRVAQHSSVLVVDRAAAAQIPVS